MTAVDRMALERWPVSVEIPVAWGDMDAFQHVNNVVYLRWCESSRIVYFDRAGVLARMDSEGVGPIIAHASLDYKRPLTYPDRVRVDTTATKLGNTSFTLRYRVTSLKDGSLAAEGESVVVMLNYRTGEKVPLSPSLREALEALG